MAPPPPPPPVVALDDLNQIVSDTPDVAPDLSTLLSPAFFSNVGPATPAEVRLPARAQVLSSLIIDSNYTLGEIRLVGQPNGTVLELPSSSYDTRSVGGARTLQASGAYASMSVGTPTVLMSVSPGAPVITLIGLTLRGSLRVSGGRLAMHRCIFDGTGLRGADVGITVEGGEVTVNDSHIRGFANGGIVVTSGTFSMHHGSIMQNGMGDSSLFGGVEVRSPGGRVDLDGTLIEGNGRTSNECTDTIACVRGGGLRVSGSAADVRLSAGTLVRANQAYEGTAIYVDTFSCPWETIRYCASDMLRYTLPAPLGHYVHADRAGVAYQLTTVVDTTYPYECDPGRYGNRTDTVDPLQLGAQNTPRCFSTCPPGYYCSTATVDPMMCSAGTFCGSGAGAETNCPAGTYNPTPGLASQSGCLSCQAGTACIAGSAQETPCVLGTHAPRNGSVSCTSCPAGKYQDEAGQTECKVCIRGFYCPHAAPAPVACPAGKVSNTTGLTNETQCSVCPLGFYCSAGISQPLPCPDGKIGQLMGLTNLDQCIPCTPPTTSAPGSTTCTQCRENFYLDTFAAHNATPAEMCLPCLTLGSTCLANITLADVNLLAHHWRFGPASRTITACRKTSGEPGVSPCRGGAFASADGRGYCEPGHYGPKCELCLDENRYFSSDIGRCKPCPTPQDISGPLAAVLASLVGVLLAIFIIMRRLPSSCWLRVVAYRIAVKVRDFSLIPKLKMLIALYQTVLYIPDVYNVKLPPEYYEWMSYFTVLNFEWDIVAVPGACLPGGYTMRLTLRALVPLAIIVAVVPLSILRTTLRHVCSCAPGRPPFGRALLDTLPYVLFIFFCFCSSVSSGLFAVFSCEDFKVDSVTAKSFLPTDYRVECETITGREEELSSTIIELRAMAIVYIALWPIAIPVLFLLVLLPSRYAILHRRRTRLVQATAFLHREYVPAFFWWEPVFLLERLFIVGFVQFIPPRYSLLRLQASQIVILIYTVLLMYLKPFKRADMNLLAIASQITLIAFFYGALNIKLHADLTESDPGNLGDSLAWTITGFSSAASLGALIFGFNLLGAVLFFAMTAYQMRMQRDIQSIRLVSNGNVPELQLQTGMRWHLFLSHIWSSGQDQVATIKRQLQLLLPGVAIFLDVDDLEDIGNLERYVDETQCILVFLSKGYFFSTNCLRELDHALNTNKPFILVHETDPSKGGAPLADLRADCIAKGRDQLFERQPKILTWQRLHDFQLETLKGIAAGLLHACRNTNSMSNPVDGPMVYIPGELTQQKLIFEKPVTVYVR